MFSLCDLRFVLCSRDLDVLRAQRIMGFFILITHKSTRSKSPVTWLKLIRVYKTPWKANMQRTFQAFALQLSEQKYMPWLPRVAFHSISCRALISLQTEMEKLKAGSRSSSASGNSKNTTKLMIENERLRKDLKKVRGLHFWARVSFVVKFGVTQMLPRDVIIFVFIISRTYFYTGLSGYSVVHIRSLRSDNYTFFGVAWLGVVTGDPSSGGFGGESLIL